MVRVLRRHGCKVIATDILSGTDFLKEERSVPNVVTNPPYKDSLGFVEHAKSVATRKVAMLLSLDFLHGTSRYELFQDKRFPLKVVYVFSERLQFLEAGAAPMAQAWFVWEKGHRRKPIIEWTR